MCHRCWLTGDRENKRCYGCCQPVMGTQGWFQEVSESPNHSTLSQGVVVGGERWSCIFALRCSAVSRQTVGWKEGTW